MLTSKTEYRTPNTVRRAPIALNRNLISKITSHIIVNHIMICFLN
ncbi:hypothetical protein D1AOALGA4SA_4494 [Olavius algarvensis Delta 1 endosymbiont]|nr:hypothetical protein D1AOALGA4SA_4494 [Olavius algarvensis Delta 1 endosymbiont]